MSIFKSLIVFWIFLFAQNSFAVSEYKCEPHGELLTNDYAWRFVDDNGEIVSHILTLNDKPIVIGVSRTGGVRPTLKIQQYDKEITLILSSEESGEYMSASADINSSVVSLSFAFSINSFSIKCQVWEQKL